jgi:AcrR family transcriptional regulator
VIETSVESRVTLGAHRAVERFGWQHATLERIARESGLSRMTLHRHGLGREEIFALLGHAYEDDVRRSVARACASERPAAVRLRRGLAAVCAATERHLAFLRGLDEDADTRLFHVEGRSRAGYVAPIEEVLRAGIRDGSFRRLAVAETATLLVNAADRTYRHLRAAHGWSPARSRAQIDLLVRGLEREPRRVPHDGATPTSARGRRLIEE